MKRFLILCFALFPILSFAQENLAPYHWANSYVDYFIVKGQFKSLDKLNRPFARMAIAKELLKIDLDSVESSTERQMLEILLREFAFEGQQLKEKSSGGLQQLISKAVEMLGSNKKKPAFKIGLAGQWDVTKQKSSNENSFMLHPNAVITWNEMVTLQANMRISNQEDTAFPTKKFAGMYARNEQSALSVHGDWFGLKLGRDYLQFGAGHTGQLLFSAHSNPFDMYHVRLGSSKLHFSFFGMVLDPFHNPVTIKNGKTEIHSGKTAQRYINGHRLSFTLNEKWRFALSEVIIYGGFEKDFELGLINPLNFYYAYNLNTKGFTGNVLYNFEWDAYLLPGLEWYGEVLIDDIQVEKKVPGDLEPNELAIQTGVKWQNPFNLGALLTTLEYVQVRNRTYNVESLSWEKFLHRNRTIGYALGNNLENWYFEIKQWVLPQLYYSLSFSHLRAGEGSVQGAFNTDYKNYTVEEGYDEPFPFGVIEKDTQLGLNLYWRPNQYGHLSVDIKQNFTDNVNHVKNSSEVNLSVKLNLWLQWDFLLTE